MRALKASSWMMNLPVIEAGFSGSTFLRAVAVPGYQGEIVACAARG
jgi:hypothetical protein